MPITVAILPNSENLAFLTLKIFVGFEEVSGGIRSHSTREMVPDIGFELMTYRLQGGCSTTELIRHMELMYRYIEKSARDSIKNNSNL